MNKQNRALVARLVAMPVAGLGSLLVTRWIAQGRSVGEFAFLTLVTGLPLLFTFGELGYGGVASSAVGARRDHPEQAGPVVGAVQTLYLAIAAGVCAVVVIGELVGNGSGPGRWLGFPAQGAAATAALVLAALGVPASLGPRVYIGLDRAALVIVLQAIPAVLTAVIVWVMLAAHASLVTLAAGLLLGPLLVNLVLTGASLARVRARLQPPGAARRALAAEQYPAWPNFASSVSAIGITQLPRLVLSHRGGDAAVAEMGLALVFFVPAASLVFVAGQALWSDFSHANARGELTRGQLMSALRYSTAVGVVLAAGFAVAGPVAARLITPGTPATWPTYLALAALLLAFAVDLPLNVVMLTGPLAVRRGVLVVLQLVVGLGLSLVVPHPSVAGLVLIQAVTVVVIVLVPSLLACLRAPQHAPEPVTAR